MTVPAQTFLDLQDAALHDDFDATKYRARVKVLLNQGLGRLGRRIYGLQRRATDTITVTGGTASYALPADFVRAVTLRDPALHPGTLEEVEPEVLDDLDASSGSPALFAIDAASIVLWPSPVTGGSLTLRYWATPSTLTDDGDIPAIPADYVDLLVTYARAKLYRFEDDIAMHDALIAAFDQGSLEAKADLQLTTLRGNQQTPSMWRRRTRPRFAKP